MRTKTKVLLIVIGAVIALGVTAYFLFQSPDITGDVSLELGNKTTSPNDCYFTTDGRQFCKIMTLEIKGGEIVTGDFDIKNRTK